MEMGTMTHHNYEVTMDHSENEMDTMDNHGMDMNNMDHHGGMAMDHDDGGGDAGPASTLWYPIFDDFEGNRTIVALVGTTVKWDSFFLPSLPPNPNGIICVISNPCGQMFTFKIEGASVHYLGPGDYHESAFDEYVVSKDISAQGNTFTGIALDTEYCQWRVDVYPSTQMEAPFHDYTPAIYACYVAGIFLFTVIVFLSYDWLVERRQRHLAETANRTNAM